MQILLFDFLNAYPYRRALEKAGLRYTLLPTPREVLKAWEAGEGDVALLPVAAARDVRFLLPWGIGSQGPVQSVLLVSHFPLEKWRQIELDGASTSAAAMVRYAIKQGALPDLPITAGELSEMPGARLVIGNAALTAGLLYPYVLDLGQLMYELTHRTVVFAVWCARQAEAQVLEAHWQNMPFTSQLLKEAAQRYGFSSARIQTYWQALRYFLPLSDILFWKDLLSAFTAPSRP
ncbi:MAG: MqnA/MqnD/SBP family protein [Bacteroidia bacterium]